MASFKLCIVIVALIGLAAANPAAKQSFWKGTPMDGMVEEMRSSCSDGNDALACMKFKVMNFLDSIFKKDSYQVLKKIKNYNNNNLIFFIKRFLVYRSLMTLKSVLMDLLETMTFQGVPTQMSLIQFKIISKAMMLHSMFQLLVPK